MLLLSEKLMSCCAAGTDGCLDLITLLLIVRATYASGVVLRAHSVRGGPRISAQRQRSGCNNALFNFEYSCWMKTI